VLNFLVVVVAVIIIIDEEVGFVTERLILTITIFDTNFAFVASVSV